MPLTPDPDFTARRGAYALADDVVWLIADDGSSRLFDMNSLSFGLNQSATRMLGEVIKGSLDEAVVTLADEFQFYQAVLRADIAHLADQLIASNLITTSGRSSEKTNAIPRQLIANFYRSLFKRIISKFTNIKTEAFATMTAIRICLRHASLTETIAILDRCLSASIRPVEVGSASHALGEVEASVEATINQHPWEMECKERALCCWFMLRRREIPAQFVVGVTLSPVFGHSWCQSDARIVADTIERCGDFTPIWRH